MSTERGQGQDGIEEKARKIWERRQAELATAAERRRQIEAAVNALVTTDLKGCGTIPHPPQLEKHRKETGAKHFAVICHQPGEPDEGVGFVLLSDFLPAVGSILIVPDGRAAVVKRVQFPVMGYGPADALPEVLATTPNVMAEFAVDLTEASSGG